MQKHKHKPYYMILNFLVATFKNNMSNRWNNFNNIFDLARQLQNIFVITL